jgi:hypothetical protein
VNGAYRIGRQGGNLHRSTLGRTLTRPGSDRRTSPRSAGWPKILVAEYQVAGGTVTLLKPQAINPWSEQFFKLPKNALAHQFDVEGFLSSGNGFRYGIKTPVAKPLNDDGDQSRNPLLRERPVVSVDEQFKLAA